jgi:two-component system sensor histidine kinase MtrB
MAEAPAPPIFPARVRRRLTVTVVLAAGLASGALAVGSYVMVRGAREARFTERSRHQASAIVDLDAVEADNGRDVDQVLDVWRRHVGFDTLAVTGADATSSLPGFTVDRLPAPLRPPLPPGALVDGDVEVSGTAYYVVAGRPAGSATDLYFLFSRAELAEFLDELLRVLAIVWLAVVVTAAAAGTTVARRTLRPVKEAADAAHALAQGVLDTRLDAHRGDEFGAWARDFNAMAAALSDKIDELAAANERERRFTADVAHELRTPLASVVAAASLLEQDAAALPAEDRRLVEVLVAELRRLRGLVDELLELARLDSGEEGAVAERVEVDDLVLAAVAAYGWLGAVDVDVDADADAGSAGGGCDAVTDRRRVERVVVNLLANALAHGRPPVGVRVRADGDRVVVEVADGGPGIAASEAERIFERFGKADRSRASGGSGLGLAIARQNAWLAGGTVELVVDAPRTTFRLTLPRAPTTQLGTAIGAQRR